MKLLVHLIFILVCVLIAGCMGEETTTKDDLQDNENLRTGRFFFNRDPCSSSIYRFLGITDAKCSLQCYLQGGLQQGGYCDENNACQCNQIS